MSTDVSEKDMLALAQNAVTTIYAERITALVNVYGSYRMAGKALGIDHTYLHRLTNGEAQNPSNVVLRKLGLK